MHCFEVFDEITHLCPCTFEINYDVRLHVIINDQTEDQKIFLRIRNLTFVKFVELNAIWKTKNIFNMDLKNKERCRDS